MLIDSIRALLASRPSEPAPERVPGPAVDPLHLAACVLLLDIAHSDGEFSAAERLHLEEVLERHFSLPPESGRTLLELAEAERRKSIDHFRFTSRLDGGYDTDQKIALAEVMWSLVLSDGEVAEHEQYLTRKIANLLGLRPAELSGAKAAALGRR